MGSKNKSVSSSEKSQGGKDAKAKKEKKDHTDKKDVAGFINEEQTNVKISTANAFLKKALDQGVIKKIGGFSGHYIYQPVSQ